MMNKPPDHQPPTQRPQPRHPGLRRVLLRIASLMALMAAAAPALPAAAEQRPGYAPGELIVSLLPGASIDALDARHGTAVLAALPDGLTYLLAVHEGQSLNQALATMNADPAVNYASPDAYVGVPEASQGGSPMTSAPVGANPSTMPFFDGVGVPGPYQAQYALGLIRAYGAWRYSTGRGVTVAVLDTGVDLGHPMLAGRLVPGYDFVDGTANPADVAAHVDSNGDGSQDDALGHGTHVAGIVAVTAPGVAIMPIKVLDSDGVGTAFNVAQGIYFAASHGARVINLSLGLAGRDRTIGTALSRAQQGGVVAVASAGNDDLFNAVQSPAVSRGVLAVAATDANDVKARFSNFGAPVDVCAPGVGIYSLFYNDGYATWSGTSMAAPFASAEAALLIAMHPGWPAGTVVARIRSTADPIDALNPAYAGELGTGRIDLLAAVRPG